MFFSRRQVSESYNGLKYEYSFPCPDCVDSRSAEPSLFSTTLLRRANEFKAPFLQCHKFFHAISIKEILSVMPVEGVSSLDLHLQYSLNDLTRLKNNFKYDLTFWYCEKDIPDMLDSSDNSRQSSCSPLDLIEKIKNEEYKVWYTKKPSHVKLDHLTYVIKESKLVVLAISSEFAKDEKCIQVFELVKNLTKKSYILVEFGHMGDHKWLENARFASICSDFRVIMQDPGRFAVKLAEILDVIERQLKDTKIVDAKSGGAKTKAPTKAPDVFISYCWSNSLDAVNKGTKSEPKSLGWMDPRALVAFFQQKNIECWIDVQEINSSNSLFGEITKGMNEAVNVFLIFMKY
jgi:hypothetical protein